jgi:3-phenylpropionate/cinnamic acid dioxygenase small subunit
MTAVETSTGTTTATERISASDPTYGQILDFLIDEAALLDDDLHNEWLAMMTDDISYRMPVRKTLYRRDGRGFDDLNSHFDDDRMSLALRVRRSVEIPSAYDRDPAPRIRRAITNVVVHKGDNDNEYKATSYIMLLRNRFDAPTYDILTAKREDVLRLTDNGLKLAKRLILVDQSAFGAPYLNVFM